MIFPLLLLSICDSFFKHFIINYLLFSAFSLHYFESIGVSIELCILRFFDCALRVDMYQFNHTVKNLPVILILEAILPSIILKLLFRILVFEKAEL